MMLVYVFVSANLEKGSHSWMQKNFQVFQDLVIEQLLEFKVVSLLCNTILGLLPELIRYIVVSETLTIVH